MNDLKDILISVVGDLLNLQYSAQAAHWNIEGENFPQLHELFQECYEQAYSAMDDIAEQARQMGFYLPVSLTELMGNCNVVEKDSNEEYVVHLFELESNMKETMNELAAISINDAGLNDLVSRLAGEHSKLAWKLRSTFMTNDKSNYNKVLNIKKIW